VPAGYLKHVAWAAKLPFDEFGWIDSPKASVENRARISPQLRQ